MPGVILETQSINAAACRPYDSCGLVPGGMDAYLYCVIDQSTREIALFWYLFF